MAKTGYDIGLSLSPKFSKKGNLDDFIEITSSNIKSALVIGRIIYHIKIPNELIRFFAIMPRFTKGWWNVQHFPWELNHPYIKGSSYRKVFWQEDWEYSNWVDAHKVVYNNEGVQVDLKISDYIKLNTNAKLYIKMSDPILNFYKE